MTLSPLLLFAIVAAAFLGGLAAGYAANRSGGVWRRRFIVERDYYAAYRDQSETLLAEKLRRIARLEGALARHDAGEPEPVAPQPLPDSFEPRPIAEAAEAPPIAPPETEPERADEVAAAPLPSAEVEAAPLPSVEAEPAPEPAPLVAAFTAPAADAPPGPGPAPGLAPSPPLTRLRGMTPALAAELERHGIRTLRDIETLSGEDEIALEIRLELPAGYIARHQWRLQAALLDEAAAT